MEQNFDSHGASDDAELAALLGFDPVPRRCARRDGWTPERQRGFIRELALTGDAEHAAQSVGRTGRGAYDLRRSAGSASFASAWDAALDLYRARNPGPPPVERRTRGAWTPPPPEPPEPPAPSEDALWEQLCDSILVKYVMKLSEERSARLDGRIIEADFYVRQLTWLEVAMDLAGIGPKALEMLKSLQRGGRLVGEITATPMSLLLDQVRRLYWKEEGGPERPPPPPLGPAPGEDWSTGEPLECQHWPERDGPGLNRGPKRDEHLRQRAEAQRLWEEKAKAESEAWRRRLEEQG